MLEYMKKLNNNSKPGEIITRLYYKESGETKFVEDYSVFANLEWMSESLLNSLKSGRTLTDKDRSELSVFANTCVVS